MKKAINLKAIYRIAGIIALVAVIGFSMTGCGGDPDPDPFDGTWVSEGFKIVAANGSAKQYTLSDNIECVRLTYTYSRNTATGKIVEVNLVFMSGGEDKWVSYADLNDTYKTQFGPQIQTLTITNNSFTKGGQTFTRHIEPNTAKR